MTEQQQQLELRIRTQIQQKLLNRAAELYPGDPRLQMIYQIGFLQAQLARAALDDSLIWTRFRDCVEAPLHT